MADAVLIYFDGGARGRMAGHDPGIPNRVHLAEGRHVGQPDIGGQQLCFIGARLGEVALDGGEDFPGLLGDALARVLMRDNSGKINRVAVDDDLAHPRPDFKRQILEAFTRGNQDRPDTTFGNVNADVLDRFCPSFERLNFVDIILNSDWLE